MFIREMKPDELYTIIRIYVDTFKATHKGVVSDAFLNGLSYENAQPRFERILNHVEHRPFCYVAEHQGDVIGYALAGLAGERSSLCQMYQSELKTMYVLPNYHRMGIGRSLIRVVAERFQHEQVSSLYVGVFRDNYPARRFYEALGAQLIEECLGEIRGEEIMLATYGWTSVQELLQLLTH
jgi:L-amino acid N-acyltransferase YncA